jgi:PAS domain S-box-containing protein
MGNATQKPQRDVILDSINEGVFTVDPAWRITSFNLAAERITGISRQEAIGRCCRDVFHADICETACALKETFDTGRPVENASAHIADRHGRRIPIRISTAILKDDDGNVIGGVESLQDLSRVEQLRKELDSRYTYEDIVGRSNAMKKLFKILPQVAQSNSTVLIEGPSGTGKELFARAIHNISTRKDHPFVAVNCAALPDALLESELFGHKAGAFTDARRDKTGRFELANGGTIFLDEIGDISPAMQMRLLRVLQDHIIEPLGATQPKAVDIRVVAATNKDLTHLLKTGQFREDLYYRIRVVHMVLPCLRDRREDIPLLIDHLVGKFNRLQGKDIAGVSTKVVARLMAYDFPGNVRELENIIEQAFVLCSGGIIGVEHLPPELRPEKARMSEGVNSLNLRIMETHFISEALHVFKGNRSKVADALGINVATLYRKIKSLNIQVPDGDGRSRNMH